jgi:hypothetical protein
MQLPIMHLGLSVSARPQPRGKCAQFFVWARLGVRDRPDGFTGHRVVAHISGAGLGYLADRLTDPGQ